jgi:hypothetical protein
MEEFWLWKPGPPYNKLEQASVERQRFAPEIIIKIPEESYNGGDIVILNPVGDDYLHGKIVGENGITAYYDHGILHNVEGPAIITNIGNTVNISEITNIGGSRHFYFQHGVLHRIGGPAIVDRYWCEFWENGQLISAHGESRMRDLMHLINS